MNKLLEYRDVVVSENIEKARKGDAVLYYEKYKNDLRHRECPICSEDNYQELESYVDTFKVVKCSRCTLTYVAELIPDVGLDDYYQNSKAVHLLSEFYESRNIKGKNVVSEQRMKEVVSLVKSLKKDSIDILEVGCGDGLFLRAIKDRLGNEGIHANIYGVEPNKIAADEAAKQSVNVYCGYVDEKFNEITKQEFNIIIFFELIEHLENPKRFLEHMNKSLSSDGYLILSTPNINGLENRTSSYNDYRLLAHAICPPAHLQGFSRESLSILAYLTSFRINSLTAKGAFDVPAMNYYSENGKLSQEQPFAKTITSTQESSSIQELINFVDASSTMQAILSKHK